VDAIGTHDWNPFPESGTATTVSAAAQTGKNLQDAKINPPSTFALCEHLRKMHRCRQPQDCPFKCAQRIWRAFKPFEGELPRALREFLSGFLQNMVTM
jgi:hypothetical protein